MKSDYEILEVGLRLWETAKEIRAKKSEEEAKRAYLWYAINSGNLDMRHYKEVH